MFAIECNQKEHIMTRPDYSELKLKAIEGTIPDNQNPIFILSSVDTILLVDILQNKYDIIEIAKRELENRGLNITGQWIGFNHKIA